MRTLSLRREHTTGRGLRGAWARYHIVYDPSIMEQIGALKGWAERLEVEPDPATVEEIREGLAETWRVAQERGI